MRFAGARLFFCLSIALLPIARPTAALAAEPEKSDRDPAPEWIWTEQAVPPGELVYFRQRFELTGAVKAARLIAACDDHVALFLNGRHLVQHDVWQQPLVEDVTRRLQAGTNVIAARCSNKEGPAGLILRLVVDLADGSRRTVVSNSAWLAARAPREDWRAVDYDTSGWQPARSLGKLGVAPWGDLALDGTRSEATPAAQITLPPGFRAELLYSVPKTEQGSWVSLTDDPRGRLIVSDQAGSLYRVTPASGSGETTVEKLELPIGQAQGLLAAYDALYVTVNGTAAQGSGLYRVRDTNGDDQYDDVQLLKPFEGAGEHGPHGLRLGPDGLIYVIAGNHTKLPAGIEGNSPHRNWSEDLLLPRNPDGNGHGTGILAPGGWICRTDREGARWELLCAGFRNPYDLDFNPDGELFTYDADMEWDVGTPWYRPTRVNHAVSAGEYGWRFGTGKWPAYYPDSVGAVVDIGLGSPTGIVFGTRAKFPEKYQKALFLCDWTFGRIYAVQMQPAGATYSGTFEVFATARPLPVTDVVIAGDGHLYFTTGGRNTQSGLYRVSWTGDPATGPGPAAPGNAAAKARADRRRLEAFHQRQDPQAIEAAWPALNSADRSLRYAARVAIEHQPLAGWKDRALAEERPTAAIQALLALTRSGDAALQPAVLERLNRLPHRQLSEEQLLDALRVYALAFTRLGGKTAGSAARVADVLGPLFPAQSEPVNRELCSLLVFVEAPGVIERAMRLLQAAQTQEDQFYYVFVLRNLRDDWSIDQRRAWFSWLNLAEQRYHGGASFQKFVQQVRRDAAETLTAEVKAALQEVLVGRQSVEVVKLETTRKFVHNWQMQDLSPHLGEVGRGRSFENGRQAYAAAQCAKCHRFGQDGGATGPDITAVGNRFDNQYLLESLLVPSKVVSDQYVNTIIQTDDGRVIVGRIIEENADRLMVRTDPFARELTAVPRAAIEARQPSPTSEMPQGLVNVLSRDEILDLLAYLRSGGNPDDKAFTPAAN